MINRLLTILALLPVLAMGANVDVVRGFSAGAGAGSWTSTTTGTDVVWAFQYNDWTNAAVSPVYSNLLAWYDFSTNGATSTNWADSSTNGYVAYSATTTNYGLTWSGANGGKIVMDGGTAATSGVFVSGLSGIGKYSISNSSASFWLRPDFSSDGSATSDGASHYFMSHHVVGSSNTNAVRDRFTSSGSWSCLTLTATNGAIGHTLGGSSLLSSNEWIHVAQTRSFDGTTLSSRLYVNGSLVLSGGNARLYGPLVGQIRIGSQDQTTAPSPWKGDIADVRFFNRALTADEVKYWLYVPDKHGGTNYP